MHTSLYRNAISTAHPEGQPSGERDVIDMPSQTTSTTSTTTPSPSDDDLPDEFRGKSSEEIKLILAQRKDALDRAILEIQARKRLRGMDFYIPNAMQFKAHCSTAKTVAICAGNRSGKSVYGAMELCFHMTGNYPDWYPLERRMKQPIKAVISATSFAMVQRVIEPKVVSLLPKDYYRIKRSPQGYMSRIIGNNGSFCDVLTLEMGDMAYESADFDFVWEDEPQQKRKREALCRGLIDRNGLEVMTFTPLGEPWMKEEIIDRADGKKIALFTASTRDNMQDINGNPILSEEAIQRFEESVSEDYRETRLHGTFFTMRGVIYKSFSDAHILDDMPYEYPNPVICVVDPHDRLPHHVIWAYIDRQDDIYVDHELIVHCELPDLAKKILSTEKMRGYRMKKRFIDPNFGRKPAASGSNFSVIQELRKHGVGFYEPCDDIELGHMVVREYLHYEKSKPITAINKPKLFFSRERVPVTIRSMRNLQYEEWRGTTKDEKNAKEVEKEKDNHGADTIRYLCIERPKYTSPHKTQEGTSHDEAPY